MKFGEKFLNFAVDLKQSFNWKDDLKDFLIIVITVILVTTGVGLASRWGWF